MPSPYCERAINDALRHGRALLKFISPNDAGLTGGHQSGFYLPKGAWEMFTTQPPERGVNQKHEVCILWQDGRTTQSVVTWYGQAKNEYRLTRFGRDFPFLNPDAVGNLLVIVPVTIADFRAYVLDLEEDIVDLQVSLGVEVLGAWGIYQVGLPREETEGECVERRFREFAAEVEEFPPGDEFSNTTRQALVECMANFARLPCDDRLLRAVEAEYRLFQLVERRLCSPQINQLFESVDAFLSAAASIMNRRKSRAGRSFENHMSYILQDAGIPFEVRPEVDGRPDLIIPNTAAYNDESYPLRKLFVVGLKTTCKDRWRQVLNEGRRVQNKHLVTLQRGISFNQLNEMAQSHVSLIVPTSLQGGYPADSLMSLQSIQEFIDQVRTALFD